MNTQISLFDLIDKKIDIVLQNTPSDCKCMLNENIDTIFSYYNQLNEDLSHYTSRDDICTPMDCVKTMIDYIPDALWNKQDLKILDPCCGNGNFGAYISTKTSIDNIYFNDINVKRLSNCKTILNATNVNNEDYFYLSGKFNQQYDLIVANPPYSGGGNKNRSLSKYFIEESIDRLNNYGYLCFITPNNWMTYNNNNTTLHKLLNEGSFIVIDNDAKKYFPNVGSSFTIIVWQKTELNNRTTIYNNYLIKDKQEGVIIPKSLKFMPLYISQIVLDLITKMVVKQENKFRYRCDLHNYTKRHLLNDKQNEIFKYETIHTPKKTRYATVKQDIYDKWIIVIPLSTYFKPYIKHNVNTTQSVGYMAFDNEDDAKNYIKKLIKPICKVIIHLTRYGNFNNIMVLKHLDFDNDLELSTAEKEEINKLFKLIKY